MIGEMGAMARAVRRDTVLHSFERVQGEVEARLAAVPPPMMGRPTHLPGWDVRRLAAHLVWVDLRYAAMADHRDPPPRETESAGDGIGGDAAALRRAGERARLAFARPGMLEEWFAAPWCGEQGGCEPGYVLVQHVVIELLTHGWDLARATGQPTDLAPEQARQALEVVHAWYGDPVARGGAGFAPPRPVPEGAGQADRLAAYLGRQI
ncbi:TIGR03086 family protein [Thermomonospora echinospora]|uniref:TIGR03086 family protein n=1 Tax=Thermomonospora echinospora TaxID=1992 RepID=A0A1H6DHH4_9ACTN|nr:TIGR03086 family metal-binding protein [Thermomonospora echinospora]SEG84661.1 TIGR03086 family protein [Thermomonospora echinospora]